MNNNTDQSMLATPLLFFIVLTEGFVTIAAEILTIRQLIPVAGSNVVITSFIIGVFLLFLAIGYWRGGCHREELISVLRRNFIRAAVLFGIGLSYAFIAMLFYGFETYILNNTIVILIIYLLLIIAPLVFFLGQTIPITMNLFVSKQRIGLIGGKVLAFSTIGSFLGALITTLVLMHYLGVAWTIMINFILLLMLIMILSMYRQIGVLALILLVLTATFAYSFNVYFEQRFFLSTTNYSNYRLIQPFRLNQKRMGKLFSINDSESSFLDKNNRGFKYAELIKRILFSDLHLHNKDILILGAGGFTLTAEGTHGNRVTYVDIDPQLKKIVTHHFQKRIHGKFIAADARVYLRHMPHKYDVIISDAYRNPRALPGYLITREHLLNIKSGLQSGGYAIFNIIERPFLTDDYSKHLDSTIRSVFANCMVIPMGYTKRINNVIYVCKKSPNERDNRIYSDDRNNAAIDYISQHPQ